MPIEVPSPPLRRINTVRDSASRSAGSAGPGVEVPMVSAAVPTGSTSASRIIPVNPAAGASKFAAKMARGGPTPASDILASAAASASQAWQASRAFDGDGSGQPAGMASRKAGRGSQRAAKASPMATRIAGARTRPRWRWPSHRSRRRSSEPRAPCANAVSLSEVELSASRPRSRRAGSREALNNDPRVASRRRWPRRAWRGGPDRSRSRRDATSLARNR